MKVKADSPYAAMLEQFFVSAFPGAQSTDPCAIFEAVAKAIVATGKIRYGASPNPESLVVER